MVPVAINGIGVLGGFGCGLDALEAALIRKPPAGQWVDFNTTRGPVHVPGMLAETTLLADYMPKRTLRRINHNNRVALLAAFMALGDADMFEATQRGRMGIIVGTGYGATCNNFDFQHLSSDGADFSGSPTKFSNSVHNAAAAYISIALNENGPNHSISHLDMSFPSALMTAIQWLGEERIDTVLVGGCDEFCKALAYEWFCNHMTPEQQNLELPLSGVPPLVGEGACFFVLARATNNGARYGVIHQAAMQRGPLKEGSLPRAGAYIVSANGMNLLNRSLTQWIPSNAGVATNSHIYGTLPVGAAFDMAIAALSLKQQKLFAPRPWEALFENVHTPDSAPRALSDESICCLQLGVGSTLGWFSIESGPSNYL